MLVQNTLFRMGGAGIVLSNKAADRYRAKYRLFCVVRVTKAAHDAAYKSVWQVCRIFSSLLPFLFTMA
jgi:3-ketoacyl-CoA synthase